MAKFSFFYILLLSILFSLNASAVNFYWVGGTGNWSNFATHWATTSGGGIFQPNAPTSADNVFFDANSFSAGGQIVTIDVVANCLDMNWTGAINTPTLAGSSSLKIYGSLTFIGTMTKTYTGGITFLATSVGKTITTAGLSLTNKIIFNGLGGAWTLQDALNTTKAIVLSKGTFITNNQTVNCNYLDCYNFNNATKVITLGSSIFNINGGTTTRLLDLRGSSITVNKGTSNIILSMTASSKSSLYFNGKILYNLTTPSGDFGLTFNGAATFNNLTIGGGNFITLESTKTYTVQGTLSTAATCINYISLTASISGTLATLDFPNGIQSTSDLIVNDITCSTNTNTCTNCVDLVAINGTWSFVTPIVGKNLYWIGGTGNYSDATHWATISGGANDVVCSPTPLDNVFFDVNSFLAASQIVTTDKIISFCNNMDWTGSINSPTLKGYEIINVLGTLKLLAAASMTVSGLIDLTFGSAANPTTIDTQNQPFYNVSFGGSGYYTLESNLDVNSTLAIGATATLDVLPNGGLVGTAEKNINVAASWSNLGIFNERANSTAWVILDGSGSIDNDETFYNLETNTLSGVGHFVFGNNITVTNTYKGTLGEFEYSPAGVKIFASNNLFILNGGIFNVGSSNATVNIGNGTTEDLPITGGTFKITNGVVNVKNQFNMSSGNLQMGGGTLNIGTSVNADAVDRFVISGGTYNLTGGIIDIQSTGGGAVTDLAIDIQTGAIIGTITDGAAGNTIKISASNFNSYISVFNTKKIASLEIATGLMDAILSDNLDCDGNVILTSGQLNSNLKTINLTSNWTNNSATSPGFIQGTQRVTFDGIINSQNLNGTAATTFYDVTINNTFVGGQIILATNSPTISNSLTLTQGDINATAVNLLLSDGSIDPGISGGTANSHIVGTLVKTYSNTTPITFPLGDGTNYSPVDVTPSAVSSEIWTVAFNSITPANSISLCEPTFDHISDSYYWDINPTGGLASKLKFYWNSTSNVNELNTTNGELTIAHWNATCNAGSPGWELAPGNTVVATDYVKNLIDNQLPNTLGSIVTNNNVTAYSPFSFATTLSKVAQPLPIELLSFSGKYKSFNKLVELTWTTATEINNNYFTVERLNEATNTFDYVGKVNGNGNSNRYKTYFLNDYDYNPEANFYRLKQVDFDGVFSYSDIISVNVSGESINDAFIVYPNPLKGNQIFVKFTNTISQKKSVSLKNILGEEVGIEVYKAENRWTIKAAKTLSKGIYFLTIGNTSHTEKIVVQ